ncbi:cytidine deaminase [Plantactinospora sp. WMMC1484]|uniref:cytidine deaminase n=1 Tax=Plantactinospora sp. WMMC1484 TaxID=3404122 RepID=UPI003BF472E5
MEIDWAKLRAAATDVMRHAYAPYSNFPVGAAALVDDGRIVVGCNVENAGYGVALCAECGVVSALHASGGGRLVALSCVGATGEPLMPCGRCRQLLWENGGPECLVEADPVPLRMAELLPHAFGVQDLEAIAASVKVPPVPEELAAWRGRGTVFVHPDLSGGRRVWTGYWERAAGDSAGAQTGVLEEAPSWDDPDEAVTWGLARTPRVVVVDADGAMFWAGEGEPPVEIPRRWGS